MLANLKNPSTNQVKQVKVGFSWTTFFFGCFPALFRRDRKWFIIILILEIITGAPSAGIGLGFINIIFGFIYNKLYINELLKSGYVPADSASKNALLSKGIEVK